MLILANKQDLPGALPLSELRAVLKLDELTQSHHYGVQACSAFADQQCILEEDGQEGDLVYSDLPVDAKPQLVGKQPVAAAAASDGIVRGFAWLIDDLQQTIFMQD